ncbi:MAG: EF-Tu/IF-2/RF-3 family GTPase [Candidatus Altiarchaeota archaeon]|nr:EF-Tu/IF-2/RF-3 family GTPase [Candidatus Altiarchaeota archaeon]
MSLRGNVTAVLGGGLASTLGKKGTSSDVTLYNHKLDDAVLSFVEASSYPEKIQSLVSSLNIADQVLLKVEKLDSFLAETLVALDLAGLPCGHMIFAGGVVPETLKAMVPDSVIWSYPVVEEQVMVLREKLAEFKVESSGECVVQVDHSFMVKGVGTVVLGVVKKGILRKHDELTIYPDRKKALVKSLQVHDVDVPEAPSGVRVGLALKDITPEDISRGKILSTSQSIATSNTLELDATLSKYSPRQLKAGDSVMVNSILNYIPAKVVEGSVNPGGKGKVKLALEKELIMLPGRVILLDPGAKPPRAFGYGTI